MALRAHGRSRYRALPSAPSQLPPTLPLTIDIDEPIVIPQGSSAGGGGGHEPNEAQVGMLAEMGFSHAQARKALRETVRSACAARSYNQIHQTRRDTVERRRRARRRVVVLTPRRYRRSRTCRAAHTRSTRGGRTSQVAGAIPPTRIRIA
jgi:hypothetical protein